MSQSSQSSDGSQKEIFFCVLCTDLRVFEVKTELESHLRQTHFKTSPPEETVAIDLFIDRHIKYQEQLNKCMSQKLKTIPDRNKIIYRGCPMCDKIIEVYNIRSEPKSAEIYEFTIKDLNVDYSGSNVNHINPHLRYYPYECIFCIQEVEKAEMRGETDREVVKTAVKAMMRRHIIDRHLKNSRVIKDELEEAVDRATKTMKVFELEKLTKKPSVQTVSQTKPVLRKKKTLSMPGPLREVPKAEPFGTKPKLLLPIHNQTYPLASPTRQTPSQSKPYVVEVVGPTGLTSDSPLRVIHGIHGIARPLPAMSAQPFFKVEPNDDEFSLGNVISFSNVSTSSIASTSKMNVSNAMETEEKEIEEITIDSSSSSSSSLSDEKHLTTSEEELSDSEVKAIKDKSTIFGCCFCFKRYKTYEKALDHYLYHLKIYIECAKCDLLFTSIGDFRSHNPLHNDNNNLKNLSEYKNARKWVENFLMFVTKDMDRFADLCRDGIQVCCPACALAYSVYGITSKKTVTEPETIESHLYQHLNYFPYECMDCSYDDFKTEFFLDIKARNHLMDKHNIDNGLNLSKKDLSAYFINKNPIRTLDEVIEDSVDSSNSLRSYYDMNEKYVSLYLQN